MDASDFVDHYWNLSVEADMPGAPFNATVSTNKYMIAVQSNISQIRTNQAAVIAKVRQSGADFDRGAETRLANGKGSPDDMELILSSGVEAGALKADAQALQHWADANLGVDCTGFAIAYLVETGALAWNSTFNTGASCPWIYQNIVKVRWNLTKYADQPELWSLDDIQPDDLILWMQSGGGPETRKPGHISVVVDVGNTGVECAESSGEADGQGHNGPRNKVRAFGNIRSGGGKKWWDHGNGVIVVRPTGKRDGNF